MDLKQIYRDYIDCLNERAWSHLGTFVADYVTHNDNPLGLSGYRKMLEQDYAGIPDLRFNVELMISEYPNLGSRLRFDCSPTGVFLGLPVNGRRVSLHENVFYEFDNNKIVRVRSIIDKAALEAQL
jgi:predicted ester cyclase